MPAKKGGDFKKIKRKVGKKIPNAASHTNTNFKSSKIVIPDQSVLEEKSGQVTTKRNLSLADLLTQLAHYSAAVRKQALLGFRELFSSHPAILATELGAVMSKFPKGLIDEDRSVRGTCGERVAQRYDSILFSFLAVSFVCVFFPFFNSSMCSRGVGSHVFRGCYVAVT